MNDFVAYTLFFASWPWILLFYWKFVEINRNLESIKDRMKRGE